MLWFTVSNALEKSRKIPQVAIRTNYIKATIDKSQIDAKCRMCRDKNQTVSHIISGCSKLAQKEYKKRHDNVARAIHWDLSGKCGFDRNGK